MENIENKIIAIIITLSVLTGLFFLTDRCSGKSEVTSYTDTVIDKNDETVRRPVINGRITTFRTTRRYYIILNDLGKSKVSKHIYDDYKINDTVEYDIIHTKGKFTDITYTSTDIHW